MPETEQTMDALIKEFTRAEQAEGAAEIALQEARSKREAAAKALASRLGVQQPATRSRSTAASDGTRVRMSAEERRAKALEFVRQNPSTNTSAIAHSLGVSPASMNATISELIGSEQIIATGERAGRKLSLA